MNEEKSERSAAHVVDLFFQEYFFHRIHFAHDKSTENSEAQQIACDLWQASWFTEKERDRELSCKELESV